MSVELKITKKIIIESEITATTRGTGQDHAGAIYTTDVEFDAENHKRNGMRSINPSILINLLVYCYDTG